METSKRMRIEVLVASPPTRICKAILEMLDRLVEMYPDRVRVDVYYAGMQPFVVPTKGYQSDAGGKRKKIPSLYVNGVLVAEKEAPQWDDLISVVERELEKGEDNWQA